MSNEAKIEKLGQDIFDICFEAVSERKDVASIWPKIRITLTEYFATPLPNDLEQAAHKPLIELQKELRDLLFVRPFDINSIEKHAIALCDQVVNEYELSTIPDLIKKVLERAAENARAYNTVPRAYSDAAVDKQSVLDTKFDDLIK